MSAARKSAAATAPPTLEDLAATDPVAADPVAVAGAEVQRLNDQELHLAMLYRQKSAELASVKAERGDQVLDAVDQAGAARDVSRRIGDVMRELESFVDGSRRARERRLLAIPAVFEEEAGAMERQADRLDIEANKLEAESTRLRDALEQHDDWPYFPAEGKVDGRAYPMVPFGGGEARTIDARGPLFKRRRDDAQMLRRQAAERRLQRPVQAGMLEADMLEELLAAVYSDPLRIGPPVDAIVSWSEHAIEQERRRRARLTSTGAGFVAAEAPMRLSLEWRAGVIDQGLSRILEPELEVVDERLQQNPPASKPPFDQRSRTVIGTEPYNTGATPAEIAREAAATGESIDEVAAKFGVPVPEGIARG